MRRGDWSLVALGANAAAVILPRLYSEPLVRARLRGLARLSLLSISVAATRPTHAQIDSTNRTHVYVTPYAWLSGISGNVGVRDVAVHVDVPFADVLKVLRFAAIGTVEAHRGPWLGFADIVYVSLGARRSAAIRGDTGSFELTQRETILQPMGGYSLGEMTKTRRGRTLAALAWSR